MKILVFYKLKINIEHTVAIFVEHIISLKLILLMMKILKFIFFLLVYASMMYSCNTKQQEVAPRSEKGVAVINEQEESSGSEKEEAAISGIPVVDFAGFEPLINKEDDKTYVINFWATWCKPCVEELPAFEDLNKEYADKGVEVVLVSLDFSEKIESHVIPFIEKHNLESEIVLLDDADSNTWIPKVSESWSGAIPATLIYNQNERKFYEGSFTYEKLETELKNFLK